MSASKKIWNIATNYGSYIKDYRNANYFKKGDRITFSITPDDKELKVSVFNGNTFIQLLRVLTTLNFIELKNANYIQKFDEFLDFEFIVVKNSTDDDLENYARNIIIERLNGKTDFSFKDEMNFYNGLAIVSLFLNEINVDKTDSEKQKVISAAFKNFENEKDFEIEEFETGKKDGVKVNSSLKALISTYKVKDIYNNKKVIQLSYKYIFGNEWKEYFLSNDIEELFNTNSFEQQIDKNNLIISEQFKEKNELIYSSNYLFGHFLEQYFFKPNSTTKINVPIYQRQYNWNIKLATELLKDIIHLPDKQDHYIGGIVFHDSKERNMYKLIDGQQRLTTCFLILRNIYNVLVFKDFKIPSFLNNLFIKESNGENSITKTFTRVESNPDLRAFSAAMKGREIVDSQSNIYKNSVALFEILQKYSENILHEVFIKMMNYLNLVVTIDKVSNEYTLFENLNTKSLKLSVMDLVKNFLFMQIEPKIVDDKETTLQRDYEESISSKFKGLKNPEKTMESFINVFLRYNQKEYSSNSMFESFKNIIIDNFTLHKELKTLDECKKLFDKIGSYIDIFLEISEPSKYNDSKCLTYNYKDILTMFEDREVYYPLIMKILILSNYKEAKNNSEQIIKIRKILFEIEKYEVRLQVANYKGQSLSTFIDNITDKFNRDNLSNLEIRKLLINDQENEGNNRISLEKFKESLLKDDISNKIAKLIGYRIENWLSNNMNLFSEDYDYVKTDYTSKSLEHIIPQKPSEKWYSEIIAWKNYEITDEEAKQWKTKYLNKIGNLMCIENKSNNKGKNKVFKEKIETYLKEAKIANSYQFKGFNNGDILLMDLSKLDKFDDEIVETRTKQITNICEKIWCD